MRPLYLEIEGVNSFLEKQEIDFAELSRNNLFCISGVTGSGKTTVLDCVLLGLYQRLPAFSSRGKIEDYINLRAEKAVIKFTFELEGTVYRTERVISRKAGANSVRLIDASTGVAVKEKADDAFAFLQEKLGLSVDEFARVIVLQQGQFAQFLKSTKADRNKMVINLFRLSRFEDIPSRFKKAEDKLKDAVERLTEDLEEFEGITADSVKDAERTYKNALKNVDSSFKARENARIKLLAVKEGEEKYKLYEQALKNKEALLLKKAELDEQKQAIDGQKAELDGKIEKLKEDKKQKESKIAVLAVLKNDAERLKEINAKEKELIAMRREYDEARQDCAVKAEKLNEIVGQAVALEQALKEFGLDYGLEQAGLIKGELIAKKSAYDADIKELVKSENLLKEYLSEFQQKTEKKNALALNLEKATKRLQSAEDELSKAKLKHSAEHLKSTVNEGVVCPVCGQIVGKIALDGAVDFAPLNAEVERQKRRKAGLKASTKR